MIKRQVAEYDTEDLDLSPNSPESLIKNFEKCEVGLSPVSQKHQCNVCIVM